MPDSDVGFSDIPELTGEELRRARRVGRPQSRETKQLIAIRIHPKLPGKPRRLSQQQEKPYQALINEILEQAARNAA